jgi:hypothetical protein
VTLFDLTPAHIVSAIKAYATLTSEERRVEHVQVPNLKGLFARMSQDEREAFVRDASLPGWFSGEIGATTGNGEESEKAS